MARHLGVPVTAEGIEGLAAACQTARAGLSFCPGASVLQGGAGKSGLAVSEGRPYRCSLGLDPNADTLEGTGLHGALLEELLLTQTGS